MEEISSCADTAEDGYFSLVIKNGALDPRRKSLKNGAQKENVYIFLTDKQVNNSKNRAATAFGTI